MFLMNGDSISFLWLLKQITTNLVVYNNIYLFSYSSGSPNGFLWAEVKML